MSRPARVIELLVQKHILERDLDRVNAELRRTVGALTPAERAELDALRAIAPSLPGGAS